MEKYINENLFFKFIFWKKNHFVNVETDPGLRYMFWDCTKLDFFGGNGPIKDAHHKKEKNWTLGSQQPTKMNYNIHHIRVSCFIPAKNQSWTQYEDQAKRVQKSDARPTTLVVHIKSWKFPNLGNTGQMGAGQMGWESGVGLWWQVMKLFYMFILP